MRADGVEEYTLGQDVTEIALGKQPKETTVVSVRLPVADFMRLEKISSGSGKSISQVVREAIKTYEEPHPGLHQPSMMFGMSIQTTGGAGFVVGQVERTSSLCNPTLVGIPECNHASLPAGWNA